MSTKMICTHAAAALYHCDEAFTSLRLTVPPELKLHDEWRGNQIGFPMQQDTAALETAQEEELFHSQGREDIQIKKKWIWSVKLNNR